MKSWKHLPQSSAAINQLNISLLIFYLQNIDSWMSEIKLKPSESLTLNFLLGLERFSFARKGTFNPSVNYLVEGWALPLSYLMVNYGIFHKNIITSSDVFRGGRLLTLQETLQSMVLVFHFFPIFFPLLFIYLFILMWDNKQKLLGDQQTHISVLERQETCLPETEHE